MYRLNEDGKEAVVFVSEKELQEDPGTLKQIRQMVSDPTVDHARVMPDCHVATSCCVGFTARLTNKVVPRFIGGDIGCGITVVPLGPIADRATTRAKQFSDRIRAAVPAGEAMRGGPIDGELDTVCEEARKAATAFAHDHPELAVTPPPTYDAEWLADLQRRTRVPRDRIERQLGTLGGGNHFIEIDRDGEQAFVAVHSGSRGIGQGICQYHQNIITSGTRKDWSGYEKAERAMRKRIKDKDAVEAADKELRAKFLEPSHPPYLEGAEAAAYYYDMIFAQCYAARNRWVMARTVADAVGVDANRDDGVETTHNYIDFGDGVWRKGAVRAGAGELLAVALNMRDGLLLVRGKGNLEWNCSAPHGAGRRAPRGEAKHMTNMREFQAAMDGVYSDCVVPETLDESPAMYKDHAVVMERSSDTCEVVAHLKPVLNIKGF